MMVSPARASELQQEQALRDQQVLVSLQDWRDNLEAQRLAHLLADLISLGVGGIGVGVVTESYVTNAINTAISNLVSTAPSTLNTLVELAAALNNDANFATTVTNLIATKIGSSELNTAIDNSLLPTINTQSGSYNLSTHQMSNNNGKTYLRMIAVSANTVTIPNTQVKPISIRQAGAGVTTIQAGAGVTLNGELVFAVQNQTKTVIPVGGGVFDIVG